LLIAVCFVLWCHDVVYCQPFLYRCVAGFAGKISSICDWGYIIKDWR
jgi:hypothetical protein